MQVTKCPRRITLLALLPVQSGMSAARLDVIEEWIHGSESGVNLHARPKRGASPAQMMAVACGSRCTASSSVSSFAMLMLAALLQGPLLERSGAGRYPMNAVCYAIA